MPGESTPDNHGWSQRPAGSAGRPTPNSVADPTTEADRTSVRLAVVAHELNNLLDGAIRYVGLAQQGLDTADAVERNADGSTQSQLDAVRASLGRMSKIVDGVMSPSEQSFSDGLSEPRPMVDALAHAQSTLAPMAQAAGVTIEMDVSQHMVLAPAGPVFTIVTCCLRNAIEAASPGGAAVVHADLVAAGDGIAEVRIDILDDGPGPPAENPEGVFDFGRSSRPGRVGVGLALCKEILSELGGTIALLRRDPPADPARPGAHLRIRYLIACPATG